MLQMLKPPQIWKIPKHHIGKPYKFHLANCSLLTQVYCWQQWQPVTQSQMQLQTQLLELRWNKRSPFWSAVPKFSIRAILQCYNHFIVDNEQEIGTIYIYILSLLAVYSNNTIDLQLIHFLDIQIKNVKTHANEAIVRIRFSISSLTIVKIKSLLSTIIG